MKFLSSKSFLKPVISAFFVLFTTGLISCTVQEPQTTAANAASETVITANAGAEALSASYKIDNDWGSGFVASVTIMNSASSPVNGWSVSWTFPGNQKITGSWNCILTTNGKAVTASANANNMVVPASGSITFGFQGEYSGLNAIPADIRINGVIISSASEISDNSSSSVVSALSSSSSSTSSQTSESRQNIPGKIEAESYNAMAGIQTETCAEGTLDVGWVDKNDWMEYKVNALSGGAYNLELRAASLYSTGKISFVVDGTSLATVTIPNTGDWQTWTSVNTSVHIAAGAHTIRIIAAESPWNLNYFNLTKASASSVHSSSSWSSSVKSSSSSSTSQSSSTGNLIKNGDFSAELNGAPAYWSTGAWDASSVTFQYEYTAGRNGSRCVSVNNTAANDAFYRQIVNVVPGEIYELSGYIKGNNIIGTADNTGACLGIYFSWDHTTKEGSTGTFEWKKVSMIILAQSTTLDIVCRLGWFGSALPGKAYFDDISLVVAPNYTKKAGSHINLYLETQDLSGITPANLNNWLANLDTAYNDYAELVGSTPYGGTNIGIQSVKNNPGGWAVAGNPIHWYQPYVAQEMTKINNKGDWSFGILHEIGHDFDLDYKWVWNAEFWANLKMYYVVNKRNAIVSPGYDGTTYKGSELKNYYFNQGSPSNITWDYMTYRFISIFDSIGWTAVKNTFKFYHSYSGSLVPTTNIGKFNLYLDKLSEISGQNIRSMFTQAELDWMSTHMPQ